MAVIDDLTAIEAAAQRIERIGRATLYLGDCRDERVSANPKRKPWGKTPIKDVVSCKQCEWTWRPTTGFGHEACPKCGKIKSVRKREHKPNVAAVKEWRAHRPGYATEKDREYRRRAVLLVGRGDKSRRECAATTPPNFEDGLQLQIDRKEIGA